MASLDKFQEEETEEKKKNRGRGEKVTRFVLC